MKRKQAGIPKPATPPSPGEYTVANSSGADTVSETYPSRAAARRAAVELWLVATRFGGAVGPRRLPMGSLRPDRADKERQIKMKASKVEPPTNSRDNKELHDQVLGLLKKVVKFQVGLLTVTSGVLATVPPEFAMDCLVRHASGDWGKLCPEDAAANDAALRDGNRILSAYPIPGEAGDLWVITEADRSTTTLLLPSEY